MRSFFFKLLTVLMPLIGGQSIYGQITENDISSKDYYEFFNSFIRADSIHAFNLASNPDFDRILKDSSSIFHDTALFSNADIEFIRNQIKAARHFKWRSNGILGSHVISSKKIARIFKNGPDEGWTELHKKYKNGFATFSVPLFSLDRSICIVYKAGHCGGLCGHGGTSVYKKVNGKWTFIESIGMIWIS
jgi:hypothetical protein